MSDYKRLQVWRKAHALAIHAHRTALGVRAAHHSSLKSQIIRAAMSIPANIVEGRRQESERDFATQRSRPPNPKRQFESYRLQRFG